VQDADHHIVLKQWYYLSDDAEETNEFTIFTN